MQFQVLFSPHGYQECSHGNDIKKNTLPHRHILMRWDDNKNLILANSFQDAAIAFLSEPFVPHEQKWHLEKKQFLKDLNVIHSIQMNSLIWVIGPFVPTKDNESNRLYY